MSLQEYIQYRNDPWTRVVEYCAAGCILLLYTGFFLGSLKATLWIAERI